MLSSHPQMMVGDVAAEFLGILIVSYSGEKLDLIQSGLFVIAAELKSGAVTRLNYL